MKAITPDDVVAAKKAAMPDEVVEAMNELIAKGWNGYSSYVKQSDFIAAIVKKMSGKLFDDKEVKASTPDNEGWLDIEDIYRAAGWSVEYDKPGYNESYPATFKFTKKKK